MVVRLLRKSRRCREICVILTRKRNCSINVKCSLNVKLQSIPNWLKSLANLNRVLTLAVVITAYLYSFLNLWTTTSDWVGWIRSWMSGPLLSLNPEQMDKDIKAAWKLMFKSVKQFKTAEMTGCLAIAENIKKQMDDFIPHVPLIQRMCNPGMRDRHWDEISDQLKMDMHPNDSFTLSKLLDLKLTPEQIEVIGKVSDIAAKEYGIEEALDKMESMWREMNFDLHAYKYL